MVVAVYRRGTKSSRTFPGCKRFVTASHHIFMSLQTLQQYIIDILLASLAWFYDLWVTRAGLMVISRDSPVCINFAVCSGHAQFVVAILHRQYRLSKAISHFSYIWIASSHSRHVTVATFGFPQQSCPVCVLSYFCRQAYNSPGIFVVDRILNTFSPCSSFK